MLSRKTYDNRARDAFARDAGIDIGDEPQRPATWDLFHDIEVAKLRAAHAADLARLGAEAESDAAVIANYRARLGEALHRVNVRTLVAALGWGMFGIACVTRYLK